MALVAKLFFGSNDDGQYGDSSYLLTDFNCHIYRSHNDARPDGSPKCSSMTLTIVASEQGGLVFYDWYINGSSMSGKIEISESNDSGETSKSITFDSALCYSISEDYHIDEDKPRLLRLGIMAEKLSLNGVDFQSNI